MIGNWREWTSEWYTGLGNNTADATPWPDSSYGGDGTWNIQSSAANGAQDAQGVPSAANRGGVWDAGTRAGVFALSLDTAPSAWGSIGFRCILPR